jgi:hypothetical protein
VQNSVALGLCTAAVGYHIVINISEVILSNGEREFLLPPFVFPKSILVVTEGWMSSSNEGLVKECRKSRVLRHRFPTFL